MSESGYMDWKPSGWETFHKIGDPECSECFLHGSSECACGGRIHHEYGDENYDGDYWTYDKCDKCGESG